MADREKLKYWFCAFDFLKNGQVGFQDLKKVLRLSCVSIQKEKELLVAVHEVVGGRDTAGWFDFEDVCAVADKLSGARIELADLTGYLERAVLRRRRTETSNSMNRSEFRFEIDRLLPHEVTESAREELLTKLENGVFEKELEIPISVVAQRMLLREHMNECRARFGMAPVYYDVPAEKRVKDAIRETYSGGQTNSGRYISFTLQGRLSSNEGELIKYCEEWLPMPTCDKFDTGYRPYLLGDEDRTLISLNAGGGQVFCQGRLESVMILAPMCACFALGIPSRVGMVLPSARYFWDGLEKHGRMAPLYNCRPPSTVPDISNGGKKEPEVWELVCQDPSAQTARHISDYYHMVKTRDSSWQLHAKKVWPDYAESAFQDAVKDLELRPLSRYYNAGSVEEANRLIVAKVNAVLGARTNSWWGVEMAYPNRIHTGEFIFYFTSIWPDCVLTKCGTRWRPRLLPDGSEKGSVYLTNPEDKRSGSTSLACIGKASLLHAWMPLMAACSLMIDPAVAAKTASFQIFWDSVCSSFEISRSLPNPFRPGRFVVEAEKELGNAQSQTPAWSTPEDVAEWKESSQFRFENEICKKMLLTQLHIFTNTNGFWAGGEALPTVSLSRNDFVDWILMWEPDSYVESVGRFRVRPYYLDKGGISAERGGAYFAIQTANEPAIAMLVILSSVMAGIPPPIAALCEFANPFWDYVYAKTNYSREQIVEKRARLRKLREFNLESGGMAKRMSPSPAETEMSRRSSPPIVEAVPLVVDKELEVFVAAKLRAFELSRFRFMCISCGPAAAHSIREVEDRIVHALQREIASRKLEDTADGGKSLTLVPRNIRYHVQLSMVNSELSVALRRAESGPSSEDVLVNVLTELFMINRPREMFDKIKYIIDNSRVVIKCCKVY